MHHLAVQHERVLAYLNAEDRRRVDHFFQAEKTG